LPWAESGSQSANVRSSSAGCRGSLRSSSSSYHRRPHQGSQSAVENLRRRRRPRPSSVFRRRRVVGRKQGVREPSPRLRRFSALSHIFAGHQFGPGASFRHAEVSKVQNLGFCAEVGFGRASSVCGRRRHESAFVVVGSSARIGESERRRPVFVVVGPSVKSSSSSASGRRPEW
jgi:hypothetical protein